MPRQAAWPGLVMRADRQAGGCRAGVVLLTVTGSMLLQCRRMRGRRSGRGVGTPVGPRMSTLDLSSSTSWSAAADSSECAWSSAGPWEVPGCSLPLLLVLLLLLLSFLHACWGLPCWTFPELHRGEQWQEKGERMGQ